MFSATFPETIQRMAKDFMNDHLFLVLFLQCCCLMCRATGCMPTF